MDKLITVTAADKVTPAYKEEASAWTVWDSKNRKSFKYNYQTEERVLVLSGAATLTPTDDSPAIKIEGGMGVIFHVGFQCQWKITKRMKKNYAVFGDAPDEEEGITCDVCSKPCLEESYFVSEGEVDLCPACYTKDTKKYPAAEHQKGGEKWVEEEEEAPKKKKRKSTK
jgi:uncharacterized cupin superfamily protein